MAQLAWARFSFYSIGYDGVSLSQASTELNCGVVLLFPRLLGKIFAIFGHVPYWDRGCKVCMPKFSFLGFSPSLPQPSPPSTTLPCPPPPSLALPCSPPPTHPSFPFNINYALIQDICNIVSDDSLKMTPHELHFLFVLEFIHMNVCIMNYALCNNKETHFQDSQHYII